MWQAHGDQIARHRWRTPTDMHQWEMRLAAPRIQGRAILLSGLASGVRGLADDSVRKCPLSSATSNAVGFRDMRQGIRTVTTLASVPVGVAVGIGMFLMTEPWCTTSVGPRGNGTACLYFPGQALTSPRFSWWLCALAGAAVAAGVFLFSRIIRTPLSATTRSRVANALRLASLPAGVGVGIAMAQFVSFCDRQEALLTHMCSWQSTYPLWSLILFGAAAAAMMLLLARAVAPHQMGGTPSRSTLSLGH